MISFTLVSLNRGETLPDTHWLGICVNPRGGLQVVKKRKIISQPGIEHRLSMTELSWSMSFVFDPVLGWSHSEGRFGFIRAIG
jgi:hypothetical protein